MTQEEGNGKKEAPKPEAKKAEGAAATAVEAPPEPGPVGRLFQSVLPDVEFGVTETLLDETLTVNRESFLRVMEAAKTDQRLAFDYLRCLSGVDYLDELETVYHLRSFKHGHNVAIKVRCPYDDTHVPTVSHLWAAANWHERESHELYGIVYEGHPDLRPLLTEEGLGYFIMRKSHPLADIDEWQEDYLQAIQKSKEQAAAAAGEPPPVDEKARKIELAQKKAQIIKKTRDEAREKGLSQEEQKAAVDAAIKKFQEEQEAEDAAAGGAPAKPADDRASKVQLAQQKAQLIKKTRDEARAKGLSSDEEKQMVAEALKKFSAEQEGAAAPSAEAPAEKAEPDRATKIKQAQEKAALIKKTRDEARAKGLSSDEEKQMVAEALKKYAEGNK